MEKIIDEYLNEQFHYYKGEISFSCPILCVDIVGDTQASGYFEMVTDTIMPPEFFIRTTHDCIQVQVDVRYDTRVRFFYTIDMKNILVSYLEGEINFTTNMGEYILSYEITRQTEQFVLNGKTITTVEEFARFAHDNFREAVSVFYSTKGKRFFTSLGETYAMVYRLFAKEPGHAGNVDAALIYLGVKEPLRYTVLHKNIVLDLNTSTRRQLLSIRKDGYGDVALELSAKGDFIGLERGFLGEEQFLGTESETQFSIDVPKLHVGMNEGAILIKTSECTIEVPVTVSVPKEQAIIPVGNTKKVHFQIMEKYMDFRLKRLDRQKWFDDSLELIEELMDFNPNDVHARLFQVQLLLANYRRNEATWILNSIKEEVDWEQVTDEVRTYYLYLSTLLMEDATEIASAASQVERIYEKNESFYIAWLLCYMKQLYQVHPEEKLAIFAKHNRRGCDSPLIYLETLLLYNQKPELLEELDQFALETIYFGIRYQCIDAILFARLEQLATTIKEYSRLTMAILKFCYDKEQNIDVLHTICHILIRDNLVGAKYLRWYVLGVDFQVRVTNIYEHYMMSMNVECGYVIAKPALMYFAYSNQLPHEQKTYLYLYVLQHREELHEVMDSYEKQIEAFVIEQVSLGRINDNLAQLYQMVITSKIMTKELAEQFVSLLFKQEILVDNKNIKQAVVVHENILSEIAYPVVDGKAIVTVYHKSAVIVLETHDKRREIFQDNDRRNILLLPSEWYQMLLAYPIDNPYLDWYLTNQVTDYCKITLQNVFSIARLVANPQVAMEWKMKVRKYLAAFYYDNDMIAELDEMIGAFDFAQTNQSEREVFMQFMIKRSLYELAYQMLVLYGTEHHDPKTLVRLFKRLLNMKNHKQDVVLLDVAYYLYKNKEYDSVILQYLNEYYISNYYDMRDVYLVCMQQGVQAPVLAKQLLVRILTCKINEYDNDIIYSDYMKLHEDHTYGYAYLKYNAMLYVAEERPYSNTIVEDWIQYHYTYANSNIIRLALLKFFSTRVEEMNDLEQLLVKELLKHFLDSKICFPFFVAYNQIYEPIASVCDYTMIAYQAIKSDKVFLYYDEARKEGEAHHYKRLVLQPMVGQFYVQVFLLFLGESLSYYIAEELHGAEEVTERGELVAVESPVMGFHNQFYCINRMLHMSKGEEYTMLEKQIESFMKKEALVKELFQIK
ncbi:MAG: DUF5717 family protein [Eubacteriales bacterium]